MEEAVWKRTVRAVVADPQSWHFSGRLAYRPLTKDSWVLTGALAEGSAFDSGVYVWRVVLPLLRPEDVLTLNWSQRVAGGSKVPPTHTTALKRAILEATAPFPDENEMLDDIVAHVMPPTRALPAAARRLLPRVFAPAAPLTANTHMLEVAAYSALVLGRPAAAQRLLAPIVTSQADREWKRDIIDRARTIAGLLDGAVSRRPSRSCAGGAAPRSRAWG